MIAIYGTLGACALVAALWVIRYDLYEREPWPLLVAVAIMGWLVMSIIGHAEDWTLDRLGGISAGPFVLAGIAATHEEIARFAIVAVIALAVRSHFNDPMDGIVYGSIAGLGMALEESTLYIGPDAFEGWVLPAAEPVRLLGHLVLGGIGGFGIGMAVRVHRWAWIAAACLAASIAIHWLWDWVAFAAADRGTMSPWETVSVIALMVGGMILYGVLITIGARHSRAHFAADDTKTLWGWPFTRAN